MTRTRTAYTSTLACSAAYVVIVLALTLSSFLFFYGFRDYISDEVYYVPAGVKILTRLLGPWHSLSHVYTINARTYECLYASLPPGAAILRVYGSGEPGAVVNLGGHVVSPGTCITSIYPVPMPDTDIRYNGYYNLEHPPLVKYIVGSIAYLSGNFRLPRIASYVVGLLTVVAIGLLVASPRREAVCRWCACIAGSVAVILLGLDGSFRAMSSIAMLDIYATSFSVLSVVALLSGRPLASAILLGLAAASKYPGAFPAPILLYYVFRRRGARAVARYVALSASVFLATYIPLMLAFGPGKVMEASFIRGAEWLLANKHDPRATTPLGLLAGERVFIHFSMGGYVMLSKPFWELTILPWVVGMVLLVIGIRDEGLAVLTGSQLSVVAGFVAVYLRSRTLYSYYAVIISAFGALLLAYELATITFLIAGRLAGTRVPGRGRGGEEKEAQAGDRPGLDTPVPGARG